MIQINTGINRVFHISITIANWSRDMGSTPATCGARLSGVFCAYSTTYFLFLAAVPMLASVVNSRPVSVAGARAPFPRLANAVHSATGAGSPLSLPAQPPGKLRRSRLTDRHLAGFSPARVRVLALVWFARSCLLLRLFLLGCRLRFV
jgi:hypothetical protein